MVHHTFARDITTCSSSSPQQLFKEFLPSSQDTSFHSSPAKVSGNLEQQASLAKQAKEHFVESHSPLSEGGTRSGIARPQPDKFSSPTSGEIGGGVGAQGGRQSPIDRRMLRVSSSTIESVREK
ncbi:hypothetical protein HNY73_007802 [Argiope bruennichi]|uniref:Uncharacterized protein n=1 Tax=Argiope bruennichi TaxID=94029 RepID=A0A8T0FK45_ARGBR|nr:hypothetical protein HNY73_007802 [Argiope bruennichi]